MSGKKRCTKTIPSPLHSRGVPWVDPHENKINVRVSAIALSALRSSKISLLSEKPEKTLLRATLLRATLLRVNKKLTSRTLILSGWRGVGPCPIIVYFVASYRPKIILNPYLLEFFLTQKSENVRPHSNNY